MILYVDVDRTLCDFKVINGRKTAVPHQPTIAKVNAAYDAGHTVVIYTARQRCSKRDVKPLTLKQLKEWGVKYHKIDFSKPRWDLLIDDRSWPREDWLRNRKENDAQDFA